MPAAPTIRIAATASGAPGNPTRPAGSAGWLGRRLRALLRAPPRGQGVVRLAEVNDPLLRDIGLAVGRRRNPAKAEDEIPLFRL